MALFGLASLAAAQSGTGQIVGTVADTFGGVIPGATVTATREQAGSIVTKTNEVGRYIFTSLTPGRYTVTVEATNFKKMTLTDVLVEVGGIVTRDIVLEAGQLTDEVVVTAADQPVVEIGKGPSVGDVVDARRVVDLPLNGRNPLDLIGLQAGVVHGNISGNRTTSNNIRVDGIQAQDNYIQNDITVATIATSVDDVAEFRVTTSPTDVEFGRGGGAQVDVVTRSGSNEFHGSVFEFHRNTALNANTFFNNLLGRNPDGSEVAKRDVLLRNQFGARVGGPIFKDKTFFFGLYEGLRQSSGTTATRTVLTEPARRGIFRHFPSFANGNANSTVPTVDAQGNPVAPPGLTLADLQQLNLFTLDNRYSGPDQSGLINLLLDATPLPNDFTTGDGLNTAGYTFFAPIARVRDQFTIRVDHTFNDEHRIYGVYRQEDDVFRGISGGAAQRYPSLGLGEQGNRAYSFSGTFISAFTPTLINEFRAGFQYTPIFFRPPEEGGLAALGATLPAISGIPSYVSMASFIDPIDSFDPQDRASPLFQYSDTITWVRGKHELRGGTEIRFIQANNRLKFGTVPFVTLGASSSGGQVPVPSNVAATDQGLARAILADLTGTINSISHDYYTPDGKTLAPLLGSTEGYRQRQFNFFFRDRWQVTPNLTLLYGARYEYNTVPFEVNGLLVQPTLGPGTTRFEAALGISNQTGTYADLFQPTAAVTSANTIGPTGFELVGPGQPNQLFKDDYNNIAPALGISWSPNFNAWGLRHLFGKNNKSVIRAGYFIGFDVFPIVLFSQFSRVNPGLRATANASPAATPAAVSRLDNLLNVVLPIPLADTRALQPTAFRRNNSGHYIDENLRQPYIQNWNVAWQRELTRDTVLELRYVGTKGTKLVRATNLNEINIIENGLLEDMLSVRRELINSGDPLNFTPLRFPNPNGPLAQIFRRPSTFLNVFQNGRTNLLLGNYALIGFDIDRQFIFGGQGGWLDQARLPVNFINVNPQFANNTYMSNFSNSTYHAFQAEARRRFAKGLTFQANYTFSKALGDGLDDGSDQFGGQQAGNFRTNRNRQIEKRRLIFDRTHLLNINGIYELPIGRARRFFSGVGGVVGKLIEGWQVAGIFSAQSGNPRSYTSGRFTVFAAGGPNYTAPDAGPGFNMSELRGEVTRLPNGVTFLPNLSNPFTDAINLNRQVVDENGNVLLVVPIDGPGTLGQALIDDAGKYFFDLSLAKKTNVTERIDVEFRAEFFNLLNNVNFSFDPATGIGGATLSISSTNFGRFTTQSNDPRIIQFAMRVNF